MIRIVFMEPNHIMPSSASTPSSLHDGFNDRNYRDASAGAGKLLGLPRDKILRPRPSASTRQSSPEFDLNITQPLQTASEIPVSFG